MKKIFLNYLSLLLLGCRPFGSNPDHSMLVIPTPDQIEVLNPQAVVSAANKQLLKIIFSPLFELKGNSPVPKIIESWEYNPNDNKYTFKIKENVFFHNGREVDVDDIIFSIHQWAKQDSLDGNLLTCIVGVDEYQSKRNTSIKGILKITKFKFSLQTKNNSTDLIQLLTMPRYVVLPNNFNNKSLTDFFKLPIGTGPFVFKSQNIDEAKFEQYGRYFSKTSRLKKVLVKRIDYREGIAQFNNHVIDNLFFYFVGNASEITRKDRIVETLPSTSTVALVIPLNNAYSENKINRQRFASQVHRELKFFSNCFNNVSSFENVLPEGIARNDLLSLGKKTPDAVLSPDIKKQFNVYVTRDFWNHCFSPKEEIVTLKNITLISGEINDLFEKFKKGELHYFIEEFVVKNADPVSMLQYFEPGGEEYLLAKEIPMLRNLFAKLHSSPNKDIQWQTINEIVKYLKNENLVIPLYHPNNIIVYSDQINNDGVRGIYRNVIDWENIGYRN